MNQHIPEKPPLYSTKLLILILIGISTILIVLVWTQVQIHVKQDRAQVIQAAVEHNTNLAVSLEQHTIRVIQDADAILMLSKIDFEEDPAAFSFGSIEKTGMFNNIFFRGISISDSKGSIIKFHPSNYAETHSGIDNENRIKHHQLYPDSIYISKPVAAGPQGNTVIEISRRIDSGNANFAGFVSIRIEPRAFTAFYENASLRDFDIISLIAPDGITYARRTGSVHSEGENIIKSPLFVHVRSNPVGSYRAQDAIRGMPSFFSYRKLVDYPVIVTVGASEKDVFAPHLVRRDREIGLGAIITLLIILFTSFAGFALRKRKRYIDSLKYSEIRYRSVVENSHDAILLLNARKQVVAMNRSANQLFHVNQVEFPVSFSQLYMHMEPALDLGLERSYDDEEAREVRIEKHDGTHIMAEVTHSAYLDDLKEKHTVILIRDVSHRKMLQQKILKEQKRYQRLLTKQIIEAQEREREIIGRELHDNVNQVLTTVKLYLEMASEDYSRAPELVKKSIENVLYCIAEIRKLSRELSAPTLGASTLNDSIQALVDSINLVTDLQISFAPDRDYVEIPKDQGLAIYRIVQEQFNNILKHSDATEAQILLDRKDNKVWLSISDNGKGFDQGARGKGIGLNNILSRTKVFGGEMQIVTSPGEGCKLTVTLPVLQE